MDMWMDVDTALTEVPVNLMPLLDATDFKTIEDAVAYNAAGMALYWHFVTTAGAYTVTAVTPTTAGTYDWTDQGAAGIYTIEIPASGGASINNDTEGFGWFTGVATGVLPWRGPVIGFRAAALNDALIDNAWSTTRGLAGTALPNAAAEAAGGLYTRGTGAGQINQAANGQVDANAVALSGDSAAADNAEAFFDGTGYAGTGNVIPTVTTLTNAPSDSSGVTTLLSRVPSGIFTGITSLAQWLGLIAGKQTGNSTARTEIRATGAGSGTFDETTDSQEAVRDRGDAAWTTATGFSTHSASDVWSVGTRVLTAGTNIALAKGTGVTGFNDLSAAQVNAEVDTAIADALPIAANVTQISGDSTAADNLESYLDGTEFMPVDAHKQNFSVSGTSLTTKKPDGTTDTAYSPKTITTDPAAEPITGAS
jgi:hypothetical protein